MDNKQKLARNGIQAVSKRTKQNPSNKVSLIVDITTQVLAKLRITRLLHKLSKVTGGSVRRITVDGIQDNEYEFIVAVSKLNSFHRLKWGVRDTVKSLIVRLAYFNVRNQWQVGFCIHMPLNAAEEEDHEEKHTFFRTDRPWNDFDFCNSDESNFLTHHLGRELHQFFRSSDIQRLKAQAVVNKISELASVDPTLACIVCRRKLNCTVWRPSACSQECEKTLNTWPLATRISPLLRDPSILDLLLGCLVTASQHQGVSCPRTTPYFEAYRASLPEGCPVKLSEIQEVVNSFPCLIKGTKLSDLIKPDKHRDNRKALLSWICEQFQGTLITAPDPVKVDTMPPTQFILLNDKAKRQAAFETNLFETSSSSLTGIGGVAAFHGTPPRNLFNILCVGLLGGYDQKVWYARHPSTSYEYIRKLSTADHFMKGWANSSFKDVIVLFGVEVITTKALTMYAPTACAPPEHVMVRYLYVIPPSSLCKLSSHYEADVQHSTRETFKAIHSGKLIADMEQNVKTR